MPLMKPRLATADVLQGLARKFHTNLEGAILALSTEFEDTDIKLRHLASKGHQLGALPSLTQTQRALAELCHVLFCDAACSMYLAACALDAPARMVLRRTLELGTAVIYLWDTPVAYTAWKELGKDLSFKAMSEHLASEEYRRFIETTQDGRVAGRADLDIGQSLYRELSETAHGKPASLEVSLADHFVFNAEYCSKHLRAIRNVCAHLVALFEYRFGTPPMHEADLASATPK